MPGTFDDRLQFDLLAAVGRKFTGITITELGDYGIFGGGEVSVTGTLFLTDLQDFRVRSADLVSDPVSPITEGVGEWTATAEVDLSFEFPEWDHLRVVLDNNLVALSVDGGSSFIQKKVLGGGRRHRDDPGALHADPPAAGNAGAGSPPQKLAASSARHRLRSALSLPGRRRPVASPESATEPRGPRSTGRI